VERLTEVLVVTCIVCGGTGFVTDCRGFACSHINDREWECPNCATERELGPGPEFLDELDALFNTMLRHPAGRAR
jgi:hypothetical protein